MYHWFRYVNEVKPGRYGVPRPFYFPLQPSYWAGRPCRTSPTTEVTVHQYSNTYIQYVLCVHAATLECVACTTLMLNAYLFIYRDVLKRCIHFGGREMYCLEKCPQCKSVFIEEVCVLFVVYIHYLRRVLKEGVEVTYMRRNLMI